MLIYVAWLDMDLHLANHKLVSNNTNCCSFWIVAASVVPTALKGRHVGDPGSSTMADEKHVSTNFLF